MRGALSVRTRAVISSVRSSEAVGCANKSGGRAPALASHRQPPPHNATYYITALQKYPNRVCHNWNFQQEEFYMTTFSIFSSANYAII